MAEASRIILVLAEARDQVPFSQTFTLTWEEANELLYAWSLDLETREQAYRVDIKVEYRDRSTLITSFPLMAKLSDVPDLESHCDLEIMDGRGKYVTKD